MAKNKDFKQFNIDEPRDGLPLEKINGQWTLTDDIVSRNYVRGKRGISLTATDDARAQLPFGGRNFASNVGGGKTIVVKAGESLQDAADDLKALGGGGTIIAANGHHNLYKDLNLYSNIYLIGQNAKATIIDFNNTASGIKIVGSNAYSTGTVSITHGSTTVTGSGTTFTAAMVGRRILLAGGWYPIVGYTSATEITIGASFEDNDLSGASYTIATIIDDIIVENFTIRRALDSGIKLQYSRETSFYNITVQESAVAFDFDTNSQTTLDVSDANYNAYGGLFDDCHYMRMTGVGSQNTTVGDGFTFTNCTNSGANMTFSLGAANNGITLSGCNIFGFVTTTTKKNDGIGFSLAANNTNITAVGLGSYNNVSDGLKIDSNSDRNSVLGSFFEDNGGYGVNIANANCDNNNVRPNVYNNNTSGAVQDLGTNTNSSTY